MDNNNSEDQSKQVKLKALTEVSSQRSRHVVMLVTKRGMTGGMPVPGTCRQWLIRVGIRQEYGIKCQKILFFKIYYFCCGLLFLYFGSFLHKAIYKIILEMFIV